MQFDSRKSQEGFMFSKVPRSAVPSSQQCTEWKICALHWEWRGWRVNGPFTTMRCKFKDGRYGTYVATHAVVSCTATNLYCKQFLEITHYDAILRNFVFVNIHHGSKCCLSVLKKDAISFPIQTLWIFSIFTIFCGNFPPTKVFVLPRNV